MSSEWAVRIRLDQETLTSEKVLTLPATNITYVVQFLASQLIAAPLDSFTLQRRTSSLQCKAGGKPRGYSQHDWNESTKGSNVTEHPRTSQCWTFLKVSISQNSIDEAFQGKRLGFSSHDKNSHHLIQFGGQTHSKLITRLPCQNK